MRINFLQQTAVYKNLRPTKRRSHTIRLVNKYLFKREEPLEKIEIDDCNIKLNINTSIKERIDELYQESFDETYTETHVGLKGPIVEAVRKLACRKSFNKEEEYGEGHHDNNTQNKSILHSSTLSVYFVDMLFDEPEAVVFESLKREYWNSFMESNEYQRALFFFWDADKKVAEEDFFSMRVLGRGGFGLVTACKKGTSGKMYALKTMSKKRIKAHKSIKLALNERHALEATQSPFIISLVYSFQTSESVFLALNLMTGGDLSFHLGIKGSFSVDESRYYAARIIMGLQNLHDSKFVYRDLKPENCLLDDEGRVRITDLGLAVPYTENLQGAAGTRGYWAPEMLRRDTKGKRNIYGYSVDWFSFGCCLTEFITGANPFRTEAAVKFGKDKGHEDVAKAIDCALLEMEPVLHPSKFDDELANLCKRLLDKNPETRLGNNGALDIMTHDWFKDIDWDLIISDKYPPPFIPAKDVNAYAQSDIGKFSEDKTTITEEDDAMYKDWDFVNNNAYNDEVIEFLITERNLGKPLLPPDHSSCNCCIVL